MRLKAHVMRNLNKIFVSTLVVMGVLALARGMITTSNEIELKRLELKTQQTEINTLNAELDALNEKLEDADTTEKERQKLEKERQRLKEENERLQSELLSKRAREAEEARQARNVAYAAPVASGGSCEDWKAQAGIPVTASTVQLINNESGCNPSAINPTSGACGIPQALPCSKLPCPLNESGAVCQLKWMDSYVKNRYNTWDGALAFWGCIGQCTSNLGTVTKTSTWY